MKKKIILTFVFLLVMNLANALVFEIFKDDFNRANSTNLGANYTSTNFDIVSNRAQFDNTSQQYAFLNLSKVGIALSSNFTVGFYSVTNQHKGFALMADNDSGGDDVVFSRHDSLGCSLGNDIGNGDYLAQSYCYIIGKDINITISTDDSNTRYDIHIGNGSLWGNYTGSRKNYTTSNWIGLFGWSGIYAQYDNFTITDNVYVGDTTPPTISFAYPLQGSHYNDYDGWLNFTTNENANCSVNRTDWVENSTFTTATSFYYFNTNYGSLDEGNQNINVSCWDSSNNNGSSVLTFGIDTTNPSLVSSLALNDTLTTGNLTFQFNYSDSLKLFSINILGLDYNYTLDNINTTSYSFNGTVILSNYSNGVHKINTTFCDAHTSASIGEYDYDIFPITDKLTFKFDRKEYSIQPKSWTHFGGVQVNKKKDRYTFNFLRDEEYKTKKETFVIKSTNKISIIGDKKYTGWLVIEVLNKWIDFETEKGYKATVKRINDYEVEVTTQGSFFESTGDLNCVTEVFEFYNFNYEANYSSEIYESDTATFNLVINRTGASIANYTASLIRDGIVYNTTASNSSTQINFTSSIIIPYIDTTNITSTFLWNYSFDSFDFNTTTYSQTTYQTNLYVCGGLTNTTVANFSVWDSIDNTNLNATLDGHFRIYKTTSSIYRNRSFGFTAALSHPICIYPTTAVYYSDFTVEYAKSGYDTRTYIKRNFTMSNATYAETKLYLLTLANSTAITINVVDEFGDPLFGKIVEGWEYSIANNTFSLVSIDETDEEGVVIMYLDTDNKHQFIIKDQDGTIAYTSSTMKLYQTEYTFTIKPEITDELQSILTGVIRTLTVSNISQVYSISYTWNDNANLLSQICLNVTNSTLINTTGIYNNCSTASSGTLSTALTLTSGHYPIIGYGYAQSGNQYVLDTYLIELRTAYDIYDDEGMLMAGIFVGTMSFLGLGAAMLSTAGGIIAIMLLLFSSIVMMTMGLMNIGVGGIMFLVFMGITVIIIISKD